MKNFFVVYTSGCGLDAIESTHETLEAAVHAADRHVGRTAPRAYVRKNNTDLVYTAQPGVNFDYGASGGGSF